MKKRSMFFCFLVFALFMSGCTYDFILPDYVPPVDNGGNPVSFATQVAPIFSTADKCTQCHKPGGQMPDLTPTNAYTQIVPSLVNLPTPETSTILTFPGSSKHSWKGYTSSEYAMILQWIKEGAKNN